MKKTIIVLVILVLGINCTAFGALDLGLNLGYNLWLNKELHDIVKEYEDGRMGGGTVLVKAGYPVYEQISAGLMTGYLSVLHYSWTVSIPFIVIGSASAEVKMSSVPILGYVQYDISDFYVLGGLGAYVISTKVEESGQETKDSEAYAGIVLGGGYQYDLDVVKIGAGLLFNFIFSETTIETTSKVQVMLIPNIHVSKRF